MAQKPISLTCRVMTVVTHSDHPLRSYEIARRLGCQANAVRVILGRLCDAGKVQKIHEPPSVFFWVEQHPDSGPHIWDLFR